MHKNQEYLTKLERVRGMLTQEKLTACYIKRQDNFSWLTGGRINYLSIGEVGNCGLLVTKDAVYGITNNIEAQRMIDEERLEDYGIVMKYDIWHHEAFEADTIKALGGSAVGYDAPAAAGPNIAGKLQLLRFSLTPEEIERYKVGGRLATLVIEEVAASTRPGDTELDVVGRILHCCRKTGLDAASVFCAADERIYNYRHTIPTTKPIKERVQIGGNLRYMGLTICMTRYVNFVPVTPALKKQFIDNVTIDCIYIHNSVAGKSYKEVLEIGQKAYEKLGYPGEFDKHHQGGPIGYAPRDYRVGFSHTGIIPENQAFCWNPSITGTKSEDTVISTKDGTIFVSYPIIFPSINVEVDGQKYERAYILEK